MSTDLLPPKGVNRTSQIVVTIIPANTTFPIYQTGDNFYFVVSTGVLKVKPNNGSENEYVQGTGLLVDDLNIFKSIQVKNENAFAVVFKIFVGFGNYIDNRLIVYDPSLLQAPYPTYPVPNILTVVDIPDLTGQSIIGLNGEVYLALNRIAVYVSNLTLADAYDLRNADGTKTILTVQPLTNIVYPCNGHLSLRVPAGNVNGIVSELYNVILPT